MPTRNEKKRPIQPSSDLSSDLESARLEGRIEFLKREANMNPSYRNQILKEIAQLKQKGKALGIKRYPRDYPPSGVK